MRFACPAILLLAFVLARPETAGAQSDPLVLFDTRDLTAPPRAGRSFDPNGFLFNPAWLRTDTAAPKANELCRFRVATGHLDRRSLLITRPACLSAAEREVVTLGEAMGPIGLGVACATSSRRGSVRGHVNWVPITVTGQLRWKSFSATPGDHDFTFELVARTPSAATTGNATFGKGRAYHVEFYRDEVLLPLERTAATTWWHALDRGRRDRAAMEGLMDGRFAIVTGLFGLDGVHHYQAELHPAYAMLVLLDAARVDGQWEEEWAVMVRNLGNEGDCGVGKIPLLIPSAPADTLAQEYVVDLGWWTHATAAAVRLGEGWVDSVHGQRWANDATQRPSFHSQPAEGRLLVRFPQLRPTQTSSGFLLLGSLHVRWTSDSTTSPLARLTPWLPEVCDAPPPARRGKFTRRPKPCLPVALGRVSYEGEPSREPVNAAMAQSARVMDSLSQGTMARVAPGTLDQGPSGWRPLARFAPSPAVAWLGHQPVQLRCAGSRDRDPLCLGPWRWVVAPGFTRVTGAWGFTPMFGLELREHSVGVPVLDGFGYRFEVRRDRFLRRAESGAGYLEVAGWSLRAAPILAPMSLPHFRNLIITPYTIAGPGLSRLDSGNIGFTMAVGWGLHVQWKHQELFADYQLYSRRGGYEFAHGYTAGAIVSWPFFRRTR